MPIRSVVDLNGDGIVDALDMCIIVDHWGTDEPLCDIGPMPWGDGIVDVQDLIVLAEHLFEEVPPVQKVAHRTALVENKPPNLDCRQTSIVKGPAA